MSNMYRLSLLELSFCFHSLKVYSNQFWWTFPYRWRYVCGVSGYDCRWWRCSHYLFFDENLSFHPRLAVTGKGAIVYELPFLIRTENNHTACSLSNHMV